MQKSSIKVPEVIKLNWMKPDALFSFEKGETSYGAYVPDLPGCVAVGETIEEVQALIAEAIEFHIEGMQEDGLSIPKPTSIAHEVEVLMNSA